MSRNAVPEGVRVDQRQLNQSLQNLEKKLEVLDKCDRRMMIENHMDYARVHATLAYAMNALFFIYVRTSGDNVGAEHPVRKDLERVQAAMKRVKQMGKEMEEKQRRLVVDTEAAKRLTGLQGEKRKRED